MRTPNDMRLNDTSALSGKYQEGAINTNRTASFANTIL